jgi:hypothetical protein
MGRRISSPWRVLLAVMGALGALVAGLLATAPVTVVSAASPLAGVDAGATAGATAIPIDPGALDLVSVYERSTLSDGVRNRAFAAATLVNVPAALTRGFQIGATTVWRNGTPVFQAPNPDGGLWQVPMSATAMDPWAVAGMMGRGLSAQVAAGNVIMSATSAAMHNAQAGDQIGLVTASSTVAVVSIGAVVPDDVVGGSELTMSRDLAAGVGAGADTGVVIFGHLDPAGIDAALATQGLIGDAAVRVRHTWDAQDPDSTLGLARTKQLLGELSFKITGSGGIAVSSGWSNQYIGGRDAYPTGIRAQCNVVIKADLAAALQDVVNAGLAGYVDVGNTNTYGGCYGPRYNRLSANIGNLSRHTWGQPIDMNTTQNCQGCVPKMDCRIVRIFRAHGFAWGGNFLFPDGMHFEWTGRVTDQLAYPSKYCANGPALAGTEASPTGPPIGRATFFDGSTSELVVAGD